MHSSLSCRSLWYYSGRAGVAPVQHTKLDGRISCQLGCMSCSSKAHPWLTSGALVLLFHMIFIRSLLLSLRVIELYSCIACHVTASSSSITAFKANPSLLSTGASVLDGQPSKGGQGVMALLPRLQKWPGLQSSMVVVLGQ